ncbi:Fic family protein [Fontibacillus phaseoli]|uniref:Fic family protein n=1 Tax=Fontibacillus phaseoli TaxID=1416533 RepID=A0A369BAR3_9BACL|nr:Fic family protein [Fontibacillus phaseoli]RCX17688.1 Fic family protein [Fontibacillus phaseoli]
MRYMHKIFHEKRQSEVQEIHRQRFNFDSTIHLGLYIKPMDQSSVYELYYVPTNEMVRMASDIHIISNQFQEAFNDLPPVAQNQFINECLVEELYNTNEIEGIRSTREEIARSTKEVMLNKKSKQRFESMIKSYIRLLDNDLEFPKIPKDLRQIYDDITKGEIEQQELPDGDIFRREATYILKKSGSGKIVHQGIMPEKEIIYATGQLLKFMNDNEEIPDIIKIAIGHYYFGYIHPFYDGNGRTSRFISSMYLSSILGNISTLSLSRGCNKYKNKYLEAFEVTNSIKSRGELNSFIETFMRIILETLQQMNAELKEKSELLNMAVHKLNSEPQLEHKDGNYWGIMYVLAQNHFFDSRNGLTIKDLAGISNKSQATIRKLIRELLEMSLIEQKGERPAYFFIRQQYFEE